MTRTITRRKEVNAETGSEPSHEKPGSEMMEELFFFLTYTNNNNKKTSQHSRNDSKHE